MGQIKYTIALVVPCFNEQYRLDTVQFVDFLERFIDYRIVFVDDGSQDRTLDVLKTIQEAIGQDRIVILSLLQNRGKAEAIRQGLNLTLSPSFQRESRTSFVGYLDADLATPLAEIPRMVDIVRRRDDIDIIIGSRLALKGHRVERTFLRNIIGRTFSFIASRSMGIAVRDTQCGAKIFRADPWLKAVFRNEFSDRWLFDIEILARVRQLVGADAKSKVFEYPLESWREVSGSKLKATDFLKAPWRLMRLVVEYRTKPSLQMAGLDVVDTLPLHTPTANLNVNATNHRKAA